MIESYAKLREQVRGWYEECARRGVLDATELRRLEGVEQRTPGDIFARETGRPLVVAFFGGTGVGKSSLLNRLAGANIARTGVERPTSQEMTLYVHEWVELAALPPELPVGNMRVERHTNEARRSVVWIDTPDIDSTRESNRQMALSWLPHVDLLIYAVSPERYRDDAGWRVLLKRRGKHGWMFVMNRWDEGSIVQRDDFVSMLRTAGFDEPRLFCTSCRSGEARRGAELPLPDEFDEIEGAIQRIVQTHGVRELERLGHRARLCELRRAIEASSARLGDAESWRRAADEWDEVWSDAQAGIVEGLEWSMAVAVSRLVSREGGLLTTVRSGLAALAVSTSRPDAGPRSGTRVSDELSTDRTIGTERPAQSIQRASELAYLTEQLWDNWADGKVAAAMDEVEVMLRQGGLHADPVRRGMDELAAAAGEQVRRSSQDGLRAALADKGHPAARVLRRVTGFFMGLLPTGALAWVAYRVVMDFRAAGSGGAPYQGVEFAIHSLLLVALAWAVPFSLDRLLRPSTEKRLLRSVRGSMQGALEAMGQRIRGVIEAAGSEAATLRASAAEAVVGIDAAVRAPDSPGSEALLGIIPREELSEVRG